MGLMAWLLQICGDSVQTHEIDENATIGRDETNTICVWDPLVSRLHARVQRDERGQWTILDSGSRYGTRVAKRPIRQALLTDGMEVILGCTRFIFRKEHPPREPDPLSTSTTYRRRRHERLACELPVRLQTPNGTRTDALALDISLSGLRLKSNANLELDWVVKLRVAFPGQWRRFRIAARVVRTGYGEAGLTFQFASEHQRMRLARAIAHLMTRPATADKPATRSVA